eukprot:TRINITY_DN2255_c0_g1_i10.p1 TRINITY_DN2255_c0_g1~~TRINITY_DN2255_c0_g1_i10.p1  ORF type:complete len:287 (-),score=57.62 TRINITY_DN2255_c0_g1_i10:102-962(-)
MATSIGALWNQMGIALSFLVSPFVVNNNPNGISKLTMVYALVSTGSFLLLVFTVRDKPPTPPSSSISTAMNVRESLSMKEMLVKSLKNKSFMLLFFAYGIVMGVFYAITTLLDQLLKPYRYSSYYTGWFGFIIVVVGLLGAFIAGLVLDRTHKYKELLLITYVGTVYSLIWFSLSLSPDHVILVACSCGAFGFFTTALLPLSLEGGVEVTYPAVSEELSSGLLMNSAQIFGIIFIVSVNALINNQMFHESTVFLTAWSALAALLLLFFEKHYYRLQSELVVLVNPL